MSVGNPTKPSFEFDYFRSNSMELDYLLYCSYCCGSDILLCFLFFLVFSCHRTGQSPSWYPICLASKNNHPIIRLFSFRGGKILSRYRLTKFLLHFVLRASSWSSTWRAAIALYLYSTARPPSARLGGRCSLLPAAAPVVQSYYTALFKAIL